MVPEAVEMAVPHILTASSQLGESRSPVLGFPGESLGNQAAVLVADLEL